MKKVEMKKVIKISDEKMKQPSDLYKVIFNSLPRLGPKKTAHGKVIDLGNNKILKIYHNNGFEENYAKIEWYVNKQLEKNLNIKGVSVPRAITLFSPDALKGKEYEGLFNSWAILMEKIKGDIIPHFPKKELELFRRIGRAEEKIIDLGYNPYDIHRIDNSLYNPKQDKLYIFDFAAWCPG